MGALTRAVAVHVWVCVSCVNKVVSILLNGTDKCDHVTINVILEYLTLNWILYNI